MHSFEIRLGLAGQSGIQLIQGWNRIRLKKKLDLTRLIQ
jgi:hypothetical protein